MNAACIDVKDMLENDFTDLIFAETLFVGKEPTKPENCVTVFEGVGLPPQLTTNKDEYYFYSAVQIRIRHKSYVDAATLARNIMLAG